MLRIERLEGRFATRGSARWLRGTEQRFGGKISHVERRLVSPLDPRSPTRIARGGMTGGDRMSRVHHNYAPSYARHLKRWRGEGSRPTVVEVGILRGSGLAIWSELFPEGTVIGLDVDLSHFLENTEDLRARGAFPRGLPRSMVFDAYDPDVAELTELLDGRRIDVVIDDGPHTVEAIISVATALRPLLADRFTYFVEDNPESLHPLDDVLRPRRTVRGSGGLVIAWT